MGVKIRLGPTRSGAAIHIANERRRGGQKALGFYLCGAMQVVPDEELLSWEGGGLVLKLAATGKTLCGRCQKTLRDVGKPWTRGDAVPSWDEVRAALVSEDDEETDG